MPSKKYQTVGAKISEAEFTELTLIANQENISVSAIMKLFVRALLDGEIIIEKGELKTCPTHDEYCISEDLDELYRYKELGFDRVKECFENHKYPDREIRRQNEFIAEQISRQGNFNPKRSGEDWA